MSTFRQILTNQCSSSSHASDLKHALKQLIKFINSSGLTKFNNQIVSYMAEQLIHKAALNGHLKFACEILRNKKKETSSSASNDYCVSSDSSILKSEQDEKIFRLASELLQSDEDSLRKLSAQLLNESQHLTQLNMVLSSLSKLRLKSLSSRRQVGDMLTGILEGQEEDQELDKLIQDLNNDTVFCDGESMKTGQDVVGVCGQDEKQKSEQLSYVLDVIRGVFMQHKQQISEQLTEVHKLMSISSDDDMLSHLQWVLFIVVF